MDPKVVLDDREEQKRGLRTPSTPFRKLCPKLYFSMMLCKV